LGKQRKTGKGDWWRRMGVWAAIHRRAVVVVRYTRCGYPIDCFCSPPGAYPRGASWFDMEREVVAMLQKPAERLPTGAVDVAPEACAMALTMPQLYEYLTQKVYPDGTPRRTSSLLMFTDGPMFRLMLKDPDAGMCCWVSGRSLEGAFLALEAALCDPSHEWRLDRQQAGDQAKRVKK